MLEASGLSASFGDTLALGGADLSAMSERQRIRTRLEHYGVVLRFGDLVVPLAAMDLLEELGIAGVADSRARDSIAAGRRTRGGGHRCPAGA